MLLVSEWRLVGGGGDDEGFGEEGGGVEGFVRLGVGRGEDEVEFSFGEGLGEGFGAVFVDVNVDGGVSFQVAGQKWGDEPGAQGRRGTDAEASGAHREDVVDVALGGVGGVGDAYGVREEGFTDISEGDVGAVAGE